MPRRRKQFTGEGAAEIGVSLILLIWDFSKLGGY